MSLLCGARRRAPRSFSTISWGRRRLDPACPPSLESGHWFHLSEVAEAATMCTRILPVFAINFLYINDIFRHRNVMIQAFTSPPRTFIRDFLQCFPVTVAMANTGIEDPSTHSRAARQWTEKETKSTQTRQRSSRQNAKSFPRCSLSRYGRIYLMNNWVTTQWFFGLGHTFGAADRK